MFLLDTNVLSEIRRPSQADANVLRWIAAAPRRAQHVSVITILELREGAIRKGRRDATQGDMLQRWIASKVLPEFAARILDIDLTVAEACAGLIVPDPKPFRDALIAATALVHRLSVITRNVRDFDAMGVQIINPWEPQPDLG